MLGEWIGRTAQTQLPSQLFCLPDTPFVVRKSYALLGKTPGVAFSRSPSLRSACKTVYPHVLRIIKLSLYQFDTDDARPGAVVVDRRVAQRSHQTINEHDRDARFV